MSDEAKIKTPSEMFNAWLYENYAIGNGDTLIRLSESADVQLRFLSDAGLSKDTEL